jgi:hypothetical protein
MSIGAAWPQSAIRKAREPMPDAKLASIPVFELPERYKDRTANPLPRAVDNSTNKFFPPHAWNQQGNSCANAQAVSYVYSYESGFLNDQAASGNYPSFPYEFTYHFLNGGDQADGGDGWMFVEAFDILKATGAPTVSDFGGFEWGNAFGGWMHGYDKYYAAMKRRAAEYYRIEASTAAGDEAIKQYLHDHADGSAAGGLLVFQARSQGWEKKTIEGRQVFTRFQSGGGHALTICGYDDDFNGGSYKVVNSWGDGFYWMAYSLLRAGGNLATSQGMPVMLIRPRKDYAPKFTFKVTLTHDQRGKIAILTGAAGSEAATTPAKTRDYAGAFNFSGGDYPMRGRLQNATLEFGLDLTDFADDLTGPDGRFFLQIVSKGGTGRVDQLSLMDYTGATVREIPAAETAVSIPSGQTTTLSIPWTRSGSGIGDFIIAPRARGTGLALTPRPEWMRDLAGRRVSGGSGWRIHRP